MKILYINVIEFNKGWGAEYFINKYLNEQGCQTYCIDYFIDRFNLAKKFMYIENDFDYVLVQRGDWIPLKLLKIIKAPKVFWASELVSRNRDQDRLFKSKIFEYIFTRGPECIERIINKKWESNNKLGVLLSGFDPDFHKPNEIKKDIDILHIGALTKRRRKILDEISKKYKITIKNAFGLEYVNLINRSRIVLNIHADDYLDTETRVFEVLGSGSFLLSEKLAKENPFIPGIHYIEVKNVDDFIKKIKYFLENEKEREIISLKGREEALEKHTYRHRAKQIIDTLNKIDKLKENEEKIDTKKLNSYKKNEFIKVLLSNGGIEQIKRKIKNKILKINLAKKIITIIKNYLSKI